MTRYFFDVYDGGFFPDEEGREHADVGTARKEAITSLPEIARWLSPESSENHSFMVMVRDESGAAVYTATLVFAGHRLDQSPTNTPRV